MPSDGDNIVDQFGELLDDFLMQYPVHQTMLSANDVRFAAGKYLLSLKASPWPGDGATRLAAVLFILFTERLQSGEGIVFGLSQEELFALIERALLEGHVTRSELIRATKALDHTGDAVAIVRSDMVLRRSYASDMGPLETIPSADGSFTASEISVSTATHGEAPAPAPAGRGDDAPHAHAHAHNIPWAANGTLRPALLPRAASLRFAGRVTAGMIVMVLLFAVAYQIYFGRVSPEDRPGGVDGRPANNPLLYFTIVLSMCAFIAAALYPSDASTSRPWVAVGLTMWSVLCVQIAVHEWSPRTHESTVRTSLRRGIVTVFALQGCAVTVAHSVAHELGLGLSSWGVVRASFVFSGSIDMLHTMLIHSMYVFFPADQPTAPIAHTTGVRVGPPTLWSYLPSVYAVVIGFALNTNVRARISAWTGAATLSIGLGQLGAGELPSLSKAGGLRGAAGSYRGSGIMPRAGGSAMSNDDGSSTASAKEDAGSGVGSMDSGFSDLATLGLDPSLVDPAAARRRACAALRKVERRMAQLETERQRLTRIVSEIDEQQALLPTAVGGVHGGMTLDRFRGGSCSSRGRGPAKAGAVPKSPRAVRSTSTANRSSAKQDTGSDTP